MQVIPNVTVNLKTIMIFIIFLMILLGEGKWHHIFVLPTIASSQSFIDV